MSTSTSPLPNSARTPDDLGPQIEALRTDIMKLAGTLSADLSGGAARAGQQISQTGRDARDGATNAVLGHPLTAVGLAAALGLLFGMILRRS